MGVLRVWCDMKIHSMMSKGRYLCSCSTVLLPCAHSTVPLQYCAPIVLCS